MHDLNNTFNLPIPGSPRFESDVAKAISRIRDSLGAGSTPAFKTIEFPDLTASRLGALDADNEFTNTDLISWVTGTANRVTVADDGDGTITLSGPQDIHTGASPTFVDLILTGDVQVNSLHGMAAGSSGTNASLVLGAGSDLGGFGGISLTLQGSDETMYFTDTSGNIITFTPGAITDSTGAISFGNENLSTTGTIDASAGAVLVEDNDTAAPDGESDGYVGVAYVDAEGRLYFWVNSTRYYVSGTLAEEISLETGNSIGLLLSLTYNLA